MDENLSGYQEKREGANKVPSSGARVNLPTAEQVPEAPSHSPSPQPLARSGALATGHERSPAVFRQ